MSKLSLDEIKQTLILDIIRSDGLAVLASSSPSSDPDLANISVRFTSESLAEIADLVARIVISLGQLAQGTIKSANLSISDFNLGIAAISAAYDLIPSDETACDPHLH